MQINMQIQDLDRVRAKYEKIGNKIGVEMVKPAITAIEYVKEHVPPYPPELPGQKYIRTGFLANSFEAKTQPMNRGVKMIFRNTARAAWKKGRYYAAWVISDEKFGNAGPQAKIHKGRWYTMQVYAESKIPDVVRIFEEWVKLILSQP